MRIILLMLTVLLLAACAPDPRSVAEADATTRQSQEEALDAQQARNQEAVRFALQQRQAEELSAEWIKAWSSFVTVFMWTATISAVIGLLALATGFSFMAVNTGRAVGQAALVKANLIYMDKNTRAYPLFLQHTGQGKFTLTDMTTGLIRELDIRDKGHRDLIAGANMARLAGVVAFEARHHRTDPGGVFLASESARHLLEVENE